MTKTKISINYLCFVWLCFGLTNSNLSRAAKFKLYHCQSAEGTVVVQDRPCVVTRMQTVKPDKQSVNRKKTNANKKPKYKPKSLAQVGLNDTLSLSPQAFIDIANKKSWPSKLSRNNHGWLLTIQVPSRPNSGQAGQLSVRYYQNPQATLNQDAFSYALNLYHEIRHQYQLIDSQFKSHPAYKIFNIVYQKALMSANTEFYVGKTDGSLWVFTLESRSNALLKTRQLMAQLQALM